MRLGLVVTPGREADLSALAEAHGLFGVLVSGEAAGQEMIAGAYAAAATDALRVVVRVPLGSERPVTLAEELAVLDNVAGGRLLVLADTAGLTAERAGGDLAALRLCWSGHPVRPAGAPAPVMVTPKPAQVDIPVWLTGRAAEELGPGTGLPVLAGHPQEVRRAALVQPAQATLSGEVEADRALLAGWNDAGATHLLLQLPAAVGAEAVLTAVSRHLAPEVGMAGFPRVISESPPPKAWPPS